MQIQVKKKLVTLVGVVLFFLSIGTIYFYPTRPPFIGEALLICASIWFFCIGSWKRTKYLVIKVDHRWAGIVVGIIGATISFVFSRIYVVERSITDQSNFLHIVVVIVGLLIVALGYYLTIHYPSDEWEDKWD